MSKEVPEIGYFRHLEPIDIDKNGDIDMVAPGKSGLCPFENLLELCSLSWTSGNRTRPNKNDGDEACLK